MGTPEFAVQALEVICAGPHEVVCVYTQPPRPAGRGQKEKRSPVHEAALRHGCPVLTPNTLRGPERVAEMNSFQPDVVVVAAYGLILPTTILSLPPHGCINIHASLLPRWRGAAPIQHAILAGDEKSGITMMKMDEGLDTGDIIEQAEVTIGSRWTAGDLHDRLAEMGAALLPSLLARLAEGSLSTIPQPAAGITYAKKLTPADAALDWRLDAAVLERRVRGFAPVPGAWCLLPRKGEAGAKTPPDERVRVLDAEWVAGADLPDAPPGTLCGSGLTVRCGKDALALRRVQRSGRRPLDAAAFLRGFSLADRALPLPPAVKED